MQVGTWNLCSLSGKEGDVCEELRKRMIGVCCFQVRWRGQGDMMHLMKGMRHKMWLSGKGDGVGGVGDMVKEEMCEKVVEVRRVSGGKTVIYNKLKCEWDMHSAGDLAMRLGGFNVHAGRHIDGLDREHGGYV